MADEGLYDRIHELTDLELAALLSLINREHCLISTPDHAVDGLVAELQLVRLENHIQDHIVPTEQQANFFPNGDNR